MKLRPGRGLSMVYMDCPMLWIAEAAGGDPVELLLTSSSWISRFDNSSVVE